ncbi:MAG: alpha/beta hydrolase, partial [Thalassospira sp.]|nr:alpha/beta hydrolase [Thalassospira sp.]
VTKMLIKDCGHIPHFDQPDQVIKASLKHLGLAECVDG